jgi:hypothetical protein
MSDLINVFVVFCCGILVRTNKSAIVQEKHCSRAAVEMANDGVVGLVYDARMCAHQNESNSEHPEQPERISSIYQCLKSAGIVARFLLPPPNFHGTKQHTLLLTGYDYIYCSPEF